MSLTACVVVTACALTLTAGADARDATVLDNDSTPISCDGKPVGFHVKRARAIIRKAHDPARFLDETPAKPPEKFAWRAHRRCVLDFIRRFAISAYVDKMQRRFHLYYLGLLDPPSRPILAAIASCESGGNYSTATGNGYYGAYQFDLTTWASVGGSGMPSSASPREQDYRAALLYQSRGSSPWPVCG